LKQRVAVIDYDLGNLRSVVGAVEKVGHQATITRSVVEMEEADKLILPGVGAFGDGMANLRDLKLVEPLTRLVIHEKKPILGICLGFQLLARDSTEFGYHPGLGWIDASVVPLDSGDSKLRVPHVGWNEAFRLKESSLFHNVPTDALFYYVHSFRVVCDDPDSTVAECDYGARFAAVFQRDNIYGTQFHPEKSQLHGLGIVKNFIEGS
jgi:glutamine amidotransferase